MSTTSDLDLPLSYGADQIAAREFATVRRGYDPDQVATYLTALAHQVAALERELREAKMAPRIADPTPAPEPRSDPYEELGKRIAGLIGTADTEAARLVDEAKEESSRILRESRAEADRIRTDAQAHAEEVRQEGEEALARANEQADAILSGLSQRRDDLVGRLQSMQTSLLNVAGELDATIERSGEAVDAAAARAAAAAKPTRVEPDWVAPMPTPTASGRTDVAAVAEGDELADLVDPRYEDLWVSPDAVDIPDLAAIEFDFDADDD